MQIVADENIPLLDAFFADVGEIRRLAGRSIDRAALGDAEVLLVRSVTRVDRTLLAGSRVRFVGTCTIGTDHLDLDYLAEAGIAWSSAPGCNARGVVDYVLGCLQVLAERQGVELSRRRYGVVGAGQVGERLVRLLRGLGWSVLVCDPPRQARESGEFVDLERILQQCDVISLHTPLTADGRWPTRHLLDAARLAQIKPGAWLINASRGAVVDTRALTARLQQGANLHAVLDVWEHEPEVDPVLVGLCELATAHIAGYSLEGKLRGTAQIYEAFCRHCGVPATHALSSLMPPRWLPRVQIAADSEPSWVLSTLCRLVYDPRPDDAALRRALLSEAPERGRKFDLLRKHYPVRREIEGLEVELRGRDRPLEALLHALGVQTVAVP
jgi:erythronate-4-phosphate dehydrogenase